MRLELRKLIAQRKALSDELWELHDKLDRVNRSYRDVSESIQYISDKLESAKVEGDVTELTLIVDCLDVNEKSASHYIRHPLASASPQ